MIYIQSFFIWLYTKSPLICYNRNRANGLEPCESSILYREGFILCCPSTETTSEIGRGNAQLNCAGADMPRDLAGCSFLFVCQGRLCLSCLGLVKDRDIKRSDGKPAYRRKLCASRIRRRGRAGRVGIRKSASGESRRRSCYYSLYPRVPAAAALR